MIIEAYSCEGKGYDPFLISDCWQVAKLNYMPGQGPSEIIKMDKHMLTDEAFILVKGIAILIGAEQNEGVFSFNCLKMQAGVTYNVKVHTWHDIAMEEDAQVIIVERSNTHVSDFEFKFLSENEQLDLHNKIQAALKEN